MKIVSDSSTLILLVKAGLFDKFIKDRQIIIPISVYNETIKMGKEKGYKDAYILEKFMRENKIKVVRPRQHTYQKIQKLFGLSAGERDTIAIAIDSKIKYVLCDDKKAINACKILDLKFITSLDILLAMYKMNKISREEANKSIDKLDEFGWYNLELIKKVRGEINVRQ